MKKILQWLLRLLSSSPTANILYIRPRSWFLPSTLMCGTSVCPFGCYSATIAEFGIEGVQLTLDQLLQTGIFHFRPICEVR
jgi:hypothetical protein